MVFRRILFQIVCLVYGVSSFQHFHPDFYALTRLRRASSSSARRLFEQKFVLDGGTWRTLSLLDPWKPHKALRDETTVLLNIAVGKTKKGEKRVGVVATASDGKEESDSTTTFVEGLPIRAHALVPPNSQLSDHQITSSFYHSMICHAVLPQMSRIGGDPETNIVDGKVVVLGGSPLALQYADALMELGAKVTVVSTRAVKAKYSYINPTKQSFSEAIQRFDAILDTIGDCSNQPSVLKLLAAQHGCHSYLSILSNAQSIVGKEGLLWGPGAADKYRKDSIQQPPGPRYKEVPAVVGRTVEKLLQKNTALFPSTKDNIVVPSWSMGDTMEKDFWPMDKWGANTVRFGFPTQRRETFYEVDEDTAWSVPPPQKMKGGDEEDEEDDRDASSSSDLIHTVVGTKGLQEQIETPGKNGILFLAAPYCRTCRRLTPRYKKLALQHQPDDLVFAKADATGLVGKELGRQLGVDSVPSFVLFRNGEVFGEPLGVTKLPHPRLSKALELLVSGADWDENAVLNAYLSD